MIRTDAARIRTLAELAQEAEANPIQWLVPLTIIEGGIHIIHGKEESYKTTLVMQLLERLNIGGKFLEWNLSGGLRVGFAELEMTERIFRERAKRFVRPAPQKADILVPSSAQRLAVLDGRTTETRVRALAEWAKENSLDVMAVDSIAKLFPPDANIGSQPAVTDVFSQLQKLGCTVILIAHPRKSNPPLGQANGTNNDDIAGSGRFAQDPDVVLQVTRPDKRAPRIVLSWGKNRMDNKPEDIELFFDAVDFRLYPRHPFLHLIPVSRKELIQAAEMRFGWKQRRVDEEIAILKALRDADERLLIEEVLVDKQATFRLAPVYHSES